MKLAVKKKSQFAISKLSLATAAATLLLSTSAVAEHSFDINIAQPERIIEMLMQSGDLSIQASVAEQDAAYAEYIAAKQASLKGQTAGELSMHSNKTKALISARLNYAKLNSAKKSTNNAYSPVAPIPSIKSAAIKSANLSAVVTEPFNGEQRVDHVLAILVEFPDYPHNAVTAPETSNYYADYNNQHFQDLLFSANGYTGSDGENHLTMKQFYTQQSGASYTVDGKTVGWVKAKYPAAYYGSNNGGSASALVKEALAEMAKDPDFDLAYFDQEDRYDLDGDGNYREPDGLVDHLMIFHSGVGEEAGGGALGEDAIWSHRSNLGGVYPIPGTSEAQADYWGGAYAAYDYTVQPIDAAAGVASHEYAHDLGLPDEYDTAYSGLGDTVSGWSVMSAGSWTGAIPGYEPVGFSAWAKEFLQASMPGSRWLTGNTVHIDNLDTVGETFVLDQANDKGTNQDYVRIDLPNKRTVINTPHSGAKSFWSEQAEDLNNSMSVAVDLTNASAANVSFKAWYDIEADWDYAYVKVNGTPVVGNISSTTNPNDANQGFGITGASDGWVDANFDLSAYAGQAVTLSVNYVTDGFVTNTGLFIDDVAVTVDGSVVVSDGAEGGEGNSSSDFELAGFITTDGNKESEHYYLLEWRNHAGVDEGLQHISRVVSYEPGLLIWYKDGSMNDNSVGDHPGESWLGVIDADIMPMYWSDGELATNRYQLRDATFSLTPLQSPMTYTSGAGDTVTDLYPLNYSQMADWNYYQNPWSPQSGRILQHYGMYITVEGQSTDRSVGEIRVRKLW